MSIKGYKVFNSDWTCRGFDYKNGKETPVGQTFEYEGNIKVCRSGFHFCVKAADCFSFYDFDSKNKVAEVEALGLVETKESKSATDKLLVVKELTWHEVLDLVNQGKDNTGLRNTGDSNTGDSNTGDSNTGDRNTGNWNTGDRNTGNWNTGDRNTGNWNTGNWNTGDRNTGNWNAGNWNTGNWNTGDRNTGNWNTGDWNIINNSTGVFCTEQEKIKLFDKPSDLTYKDWTNSEASQILRWNFELTVWIYESSMTNEEKQERPSYKTTGGYLKVFKFKEACKNMWDSLTDREKYVVENIPNFDKAKFQLVTGIKIEEEINE